MVKNAVSAKTWRQVALALLEDRVRIAIEAADTAKERVQMAIAEHETALAELSAAESELRRWNVIP